MRRRRRSPSAFGEKKKVSCASRAGCPAREVEPREVVVVGLDVGPFGDRKAHVGEDHHQLFPDAADGMDAALGGGVGPDGQRDVDAIRRELLRQSGGFQLGFSRFERCCDAVLDDIDGGAEAPARLVRHGAQLLHQLGNFALFAERRDANGVKPCKVLRGCYAGEQAVCQGVKIVILVRDGIHGRSRKWNEETAVPLLLQRVKRCRVR